MSGGDAAGPTIERCWLVNLVVVLVVVLSVGCDSGTNVAEPDPLEIVFADAAELLQSIREIGGSSDEVSRTLRAVARPMVGAATLEVELPGRTLVLSPVASTDTYEVDLLREGAPADGVRFILYAPSGSIAARPLSEIGYVDIDADLAADSAPAHVSVMIEGRQLSSYTGEGAARADTLATCCNVADVVNRSIDLTGAIELSGEVLGLAYDDYLSWSLPGGYVTYLNWQWVELVSSMGAVQAGGALGIVRFDGDFVVTTRAAVPLTTGDSAFVESLHYARGGIERILVDSVSVYELRGWVGAENVDPGVRSDYVNATTAITGLVARAPHAEPSPFEPLLAPLLFVFARRVGS